MWETPAASFQFYGKPKTVHEKQRLKRKAAPEPELEVGWGLRWTENRCSYCYNQPRTASQQGQSHPKES